MSTTAEVKDYCVAWFTVRSDELDRTALSIATGIPEPAPNSYGKTPKANALTIRSELAVSENLPMKEHLAWLLSKILENDKLTKFLQSENCHSTIFLYTTTNQDAAYTEIPPEALQQISELGCALQVKVETES